MSLLTNVAQLFLEGVGPVEMQKRSDFPSWEEQMHAIWNRGRSATWRTASVDDALSVPAIFSAVTLIAGTMGTLTMDAYRNERKVPSADRPRLLVRPDPFSKPYTFWFLSAFYKATRGERWWWVAKRDVDGSPLSLFPVPPWEIKVEANDRNRLRPTIKWADRVIPNEDMISDFWFPDHSGLRGVGPLQKAGAAVSVAVEAEAWAANFFAGSIPSIVGTTDQDMTDAELEQMDRQWNEKPPNTPRWLTNGLSLSDSPFDPEKAQLTETREFNVGDVARMFSMPGTLIEHQMAGSSLTYRNDEGIWTDFQRRCLGPIFAEPVEQDLSDLLARSWTAQFNFDRMLRADVKTRYETYKAGIEGGFLTPEEARQKEGLEPGSSEYSPVPFSPPQAVPDLLPPNRELVPRSQQPQSVRCPKGHLLAELASAPYRFTCFRCKSVVAA
jgi:HK97 family phage portal protein